MDRITTGTRSSETKYIARRRAGNELFTKKTAADGEKTLESSIGFFTM